MRLQVSCENFERVFEEWTRLLSPNQGTQETISSFLADLQASPINSKCSCLPFYVPASSYDAFWSAFRRPSSEEMKKILERKDRLVAVQDRRTTGEFFTPLSYASLAHEYLARTISDRYERKGPHHSMYDDYNWWDPCCGTGNLTLACPPEMQGELFLSTLHQEDADAIRTCGQNPRAKVFQYDFLNQGEHELPIELLSALQNGKPWIVLMNPPFAGGVGGQYVRKGEEKRRGMSATGLKEYVKSRGFGLGARSITCHFFARVELLERDFDLRIVTAAFSPLTLFCGPGYRRFAELWQDNHHFSGGFLMPSYAFQGIKGKWPVSFTIWNAEVARPMALDVRPEPQNCLGTKEISFPVTLLSEQVARPSKTHVFPPMNGALKIAKSAMVDKHAVGALASLYSDGNDVHHGLSSCFLTSGPNPHTGSWSVVPANFQDSMVIFSVRRLVKANWLNWQDQFSAPVTTVPGYYGWSLDAILWGLFESKNLTSSLGNVLYKGCEYDIANHFFWMTPQEMLETEGLPETIAEECYSAQPRFVSRWLMDHANQFSDEARDLLELGKDLVRKSVSCRMEASSEYQLNRWDAGWYQIRVGLFTDKNAPFRRSEEMRQVMSQFTAAHKALGNILRPQIYQFGFLPTE